MGKFCEKFAPSGAEGDIKCSIHHPRRIISIISHQKTHKETAERTVSWGIEDSSFLVSAPPDLSCPFYSSKRQTSNHKFLLYIKPRTFLILTYSCFGSSKNLRVIDGNGQSSPRGFLLVFGEEAEQIALRAASSVVSKCNSHVSSIIHARDLQSLRMWFQHTSFRMA